MPQITLKTNNNKENKMQAIMNLRDDIFWRQ